MEKIDCLVIGAGVIGLACARALARAGRDVIVLEKESAIGTGISSRNSEVIHAGMYYPKDSLKARLCVRGNRLLQDYAQAHNVPFSMPGKLIVATNDAEEAVLHGILKRGHENGVARLRFMPTQDARLLEPNLSCTGALFSPDTGIIDSHALMLSFQGEAEETGATIAFETPAASGRIVEGGVEIGTGGREPMRLLARHVVIAAGLGSCAVARMLGLPDVPEQSLCKGSYFTLTGRMPFRRLIYPVPVEGGLGIHYTVDMAGRGRFGPDVEWIKNEDYAVDPTRRHIFCQAIRRYWPELPDNALEPGYSGIRPKLSAPGEPATDFVISGPAAHGAANVIALYGIESPGLTASLAIAEQVAEMAA